MKKTHRLVILLLLAMILLMPRPSLAQTALLDLGTLGGDHSEAIAINAQGQIVGYSRIASGQFHAFLWQDGVITLLGSLGGNASFPEAINERGQVVGSSRTATGELHAFLWMK